MLAVLRFPEKFAILAVLALAFAGALGWQRLLDEREAGRPEAADLPLALALVVLATALALTAFLLLRAPRAALWFIAAHGAPGPRRRAHGRRPGLPAGESWAAVATAAAVAALLALCRWRRPLPAPAGGRWRSPCWPPTSGTTATGWCAPCRPPPTACRRRSRPRSSPPRTGSSCRRRPPAAPELVPRAWGETRGRCSPAPTSPGWSPTRALLWHLPYAFNNDFDLMLTGWGRQAQRILDAEWAQPQMAYRYLGVWNVGTLLLQAPVTPGSPRSSRLASDRHRDADAR